MEKEGGSRLQISNLKLGPGGEKGLEIAFGRVLIGFSSS
jgi:hypothetical protein